MREKYGKSKYIEDPYYTSYCKPGSAQYTDEKPPSDKKVWDELAEIREVFKEYPLARLESPHY